MKTDWMFDHLPQAAVSGETSSLGKNKGEMNKNRIEKFHHLYRSQDKSHINPPWISVLPEKIIKAMSKWRSMPGRDEPEMC